MTSRQCLKNVFGAWIKSGEVVGPSGRLMGSPDLAQIAAASYFTQEGRHSRQNGSLAMSQDLNTLLHRPNNSSRTWTALDTRFRRNNQSTSGYFDSLPPSSGVRKVYIFCLATVMAIVTALLEHYWMRKWFIDTLPPNPGLVGEALPAKYIYGSTDKFLSSWLYENLPWFTCCNSPAWNYITQTKSSDPKTREDGIQKLIVLRGLSDMECHIIASALDFKTAVAVAHGGGDPRLVTLGRTLHPDKRNMCLATKFRELFAALPESSIHESLHKACVTALQYFKPTEEEVHNRYLDDAAGFESEFVTSPLKYSSEPDFLKPCLQGLLSHCRLSHQVPVILEHGGMDLLLVVSAKYRKDSTIMGLVAKICSSIACHPDSNASFESADLLGLIAELALDEDIKLSFPAKKTLHNLDRESVQHILPPGIYQFYPEARSNENDARVDVVFVHGIMGGAFRTWRSQDLRAIWRFTKVDSSNHYSLCETNPVTWKERHGSLRNQPEASTATFKDPFKLSGEENLEEYNKPETSITNLRISLNGSPNEFVISKKRLVEPPPRNRELRNGVMYHFPPHDDIPLEINFVLDAPKSKCWPRDWLSMDIPNLRILAADFDTFITHWNPVMPVESLGRTISERSLELLEKFVVAGIGTRPVVWVVHSAGGILTKKLLEFCEESEREDYQQIVRNTKAVVFCSTPHFGSRMAGLGNKGQSIMMPTTEISELVKDSAELKEINKVFKSLMDKYNYRVISFGELCPTLGSLGVKAKLVTIDSSDPGYGEFYGLKVDHLNICKPLSRESFVYFKVAEVIGQVVEKELDETAENLPTKEQATRKEQNKQQETH